MLLMSLAEVEMRQTEALQDVVCALLCPNASTDVLILLTGPVANLCIARTQDETVHQMLPAEWKRTIATGIQQQLDLHRVDWKLSRKRFHLRLHHQL